MASSYDVRPRATFPAGRHHCRVAGTKLYCLVTEACEIIARSRYLKAEWLGVGARMPNETLTSVPKRRMLEVSNPSGWCRNAPKDLLGRKCNALIVTPSGHARPTCTLKLAFHDADTDTDILADVLARIVARMSACRSACHRNNFRKSRVVRRVGKDPREDVRVGVGVGVVECQPNCTSRSVAL